MEYLKKKMAEKVCGKPTEVFSRISGYYRPVKNWNDGKTQEFKERKTYDGKQAVEGEVLGGVKGATAQAETPIVANDEGTVDMDLDGLVLFASQSCPNCKMAKEFLDKMGIKYKVLMAEENMELIKSLDLKTAPTLINFTNGTATDIVTTYPGIRKYVAAMPVEETSACPDCKF